MPEINADTLFEPISATIDGTQYTVVKIERSTLDAVSALGEGAEDSKDTSVLCRMLGIFFGEEPKTFANCDIRKLARVSAFVNEEIRKGMTVDENPSEAEASASE